MGLRDSKLIVSTFEGSDGTEYDVETHLDADTHGLVITQVVASGDAAPDAISRVVLETVEDGVYIPDLLRMLADKMENN